MINLIKNKKNTLTENTKGSINNSISPVSPLKEVPGLSFLYSILPLENSFYIYSVIEQSDTICIYTNKEYKPITHLIDLLEYRGLLFHNKVKAQKTLESISYYRLSGYLHHFYSTVKKDVFVDNVYFEDIVKLYGFDKKLRLLMLDAIETIEIALRSVVVKSLHNHKYAFDNDNLFLNREKFEDLKQARNKCWERSETIFVKKYKQENIMPPIWIEIETWSMGLIRDCIHNFKQEQVHCMANGINAINQNRFKNWIKALVTLRNISAHHGRLWNKDLSALNISSPKFQFHIHLQQINQTNKYRKVYHYCVVIWHIMQHIHPESTWNERLYKMIVEEFPNHMPHVGFENMGFTEKWHKEDFWQLV